MKPFAPLATIDPVVRLVRSSTSFSSPFAVSFILIRILSDGDISKRGPPGVPSVVMGAAVVGSPQFVVSSSMVREAHHFESSPGQLEPGG